MSQNAQYVAGDNNTNKRKAAHDEWEQQNRVAKILLRESATQQARTALMPEEDAPGGSEDYAEKQSIKRFENNAGGIKNEYQRDVVREAIDQLAFGGPDNSGGGSIKNERENCAILDAIPGHDIFPDLARLVNTQGPLDAGEMGPGDRKSVV